MSCVRGILRAAGGQGQQVAVVDWRSTSGKFAICPLLKALGRCVGRGIEKWLKEKSVVGVMWWYEGSGSFNAKEGLLVS